MSSIHRSGRSPGVGNGNPLQYSCLENPMDRGTWWATVHGVTKSQTWLKRLGVHALQSQACTLPLLTFCFFCAWLSFLNCFGFSHQIQCALFEGFLVTIWRSEMWKLFQGSNVLFTKLSRCSYHKWNHRCSVCMCLWRDFFSLKKNMKKITEKYNSYQRKARLIHIFPVSAKLVYAFVQIALKKKKKLYRALTRRHTGG